MASMSYEERVSRASEIKARLAELDNEFKGEALPDEAKAEWNELHEEREENDRVIAELGARRQTLADLADKSENREKGTFYTSTKPSESDIYDVASYRTNSRSEEHRAQLMRDGAMRSIETMTPAIGDADTAKAHIENLMETARGEAKSGEIASLILETGSPIYKRSFAKLAAAGFEERTAGLTSEERTALSTSAAAGGYAVPYQLDPTVIPTSNFSVNPYRAISRVVNLTGSNTWQGVSSAGITASFDAEANEVSDDSPTLAQPTATARMARAFVRYSMEIGDDWGSLGAEMTRLFQDAKDDLEATAFTTGSGTAPNPLGITETANTTGIGTAAFVFTAGTAAFVIGDVYKLETALAPRWRPRASFVGNRAVYNAIRQFDTAGGAGLWVDNLRGGLANQVPTNGNLNTRLLDYPTSECSVMSATPATTAAKTLLFGDFSQFVIVDRIGMTVEPVPFIFHTSNNLPSGERGLFARWRTGSTVAAPTAFVLLKVL